MSIGLAASITIDSGIATVLEQWMVHLLALSQALAAEAQKKSLLASMLALAREPSYEKTSARPVVSVPLSCNERHFCQSKHRKFSTWYVVEPPLPFGLGCGCVAILNEYMSLST